MTLPPAAGANPSVDQYVESVPTGDGGVDVGKPGTPADRPLPARVRERVQEKGGADAAQLEAIATSPALGAPATTAAAPRRAEGTAKPALLDAVTTAAAGGGAPLGALLAGMLVLTAMAGGAAFVRRSRDHS